MPKIYDNPETPEVIQDFLRYGELNQGHTEKTIGEYYLDLRMFFRFMKQERGIAPPDLAFEEIPISDIDLDFVKSITKSELNRYVDYLRSDRAGRKKGQTTQGLSPATTQRKFATLRSFFDYLTVGIEALDRNPAERVIVPKVRTRLPEFLTADECNRLLASIDGLNADRDYAIVLLDITGGLRVSEIVGINTTDIRFDGDDAFLSIIGKGDKERRVYIPQSCVDAINDYLALREPVYKPPEGENALFLSRKHRRMSPDAVQDLVRKATLKANLRPISPHKLRHTAATLMLSNGVDVRTIQEVLGHENLGTTQIYTHVTNDDLRMASRANPIGRVKREKKGVAADGKQ